ncbi:MAG: penicillin-binding protein 2 [Chlorobiaceae bacterium]|nr:penicillin-binding protein 2 [Chlorobiaceae bacterium]MBA4309720.1 penicillin-binding protein 2 [Chlorobiaceae bacterium]
MINMDRKHVIYVLLIIVFAVYVIRLFQLQVIEQEYFEEKSSDNSIKVIQQTPLRGVFFDREFNLLVENVPAYTVRITPADYDKKNNEILENVLELDSGFIQNLMQRNRIYSKYLPLRVKRGVEFKVIAWIEENWQDLAGVDYIIEMQRAYPFGVMSSHVFGYSKEISQRQLERDTDDYYVPGDIIGFNGLERSYEKQIRGTKGENLILVDSRRREVGKYKDGKKDTEALKGKDLVLSIDGIIQKIAEEELGDRTGAIVAIEPTTGEILAMVSSPNYDLNMFSYVTPRAFLHELMNDPKKPQFNRATMSAHPPGSTFKIMTAIIGLELGIIDDKSSYFCGGGFTFGRFFRCLGKHGSINVVTAIEKSCNTYFYQLILKIGADNLYKYSKKFGFGRKLKIDISEESAGLIPNEEYYRRIYGDNWPRGILVSLGVGQGEVSTTPLQLAHFTALVANNGQSYVPHLAKGYLNENKNLIPFTFPEEDVEIKQSVFDLVKKGMYLVVNGNGTARHLHIPDIAIAGKTGTAQNPHGEDHAWFIGFAPYENPKIAICVLVENAGFGGTHAAPIAKKMIENYVRRKLNLFPPTVAEKSIEKVSPNAN